MKKKKQSEENGKSSGGVDPKSKSDRDYFRVDAHLHLISGQVPHDERANIRSKVLPSTSVSTWSPETLKRVDISGAGIAFESDEFYKLGDIVGLILMFKNDWGEPILVYGEVVRVEPYRRYCRVALKYVAMDERIRSMIVRFVSEREREIISERRVGWL
ncbi:MAG: PilZ domain-containing protein [Nitrospirae bacterium]|nr:PilZ domain-containing protein [Nitrospirota bacterium]